DPPSLPLHLFTSSPLHLFTSSPLHLFTSSPLHLFTSRDRYEFFQFLSLTSSRISPSFIISLGISNIIPG
ncbi:MAG TPA: hypothetical protein VJL78_05930, partial [Candidatus Nitrosocosmicus sp.]|nr:hypothetical protein [Candidatus Nitrosocosmicus sp.]